MAATIGELCRIGLDDSLFKALGLGYVVLDGVFLRSCLLAKASGAEEVDIRIKA
jgi:hypothetical protein